MSGRKAVRATREEEVPSVWHPRQERTRSSASSYLPCLTPNFGVTPDTSLSLPDLRYQMNSCRMERAAGLENGGDEMEGPGCRVFHFGVQDVPWVRSGNGTSHPCFSAVCLNSRPPILGHPSPIPCTFHFFCQGHPCFELLSSLLDGVFPAKLPTIILTLAISISYMRYPYG